VNPWIRAFSTTRIASVVALMNAILASALAFHWPPITPDQQAAIVALANALAVLGTAFYDPRHPLGGSGVSGT